MLLTFVGMLVYFRRRGWIGSDRNRGDKE
jgi:hypothetical protein